MHFKLHANLHTLHCITPTDERGDEPFMWSYFAKIDGSTLRQKPGAPGQFIPSVTVFATPGGHGDLHIEDVASGANFQIPAEVGQFNTELLPITITMVSEGRTVELSIPGRLVAVSALIDQDITSERLSNTIHQAVTERVQVRVSQFLGGLDLAPVITAAASTGKTVEERVANVRGAVSEAIRQQFRDFRKALRSELTLLAAEVVLVETQRKGPYEWLRTVLENAFDGDDIIGLGDASFREDALIASSLNVNARDEIREKSTGLGGAWYILHASADADLVFNGSDVATSSSVGTVVQRDPGTFTPPRALICVPEGPVDYASIFVPQSHDIMVRYPFCTYRYSIEGQLLTGGRQDVHFATQAAFHQIDETAFPFVKVHREPRTVTISARFETDAVRPQLQHLILTNTPTDGTYYFTVKIEAVLPSGRAIPVVDQSLGFQGQTIEFPPGFISGIRKCLQEFDADSSKSKHVGLKDLWGPSGREQLYSEAHQILDDRAAHVGIAPERLKQLRSLVDRAWNRPRRH